MRVKAYIEFKKKFKLTYIGRISKDGKFHFRNSQLHKACFKRLKSVFSYNCEGGSLTIPDVHREIVQYLLNKEGFITCYISPVPEKVNNKFIVTYRK